MISPRKGLVDFYVRVTNFHEEDRGRLHHASRHHQRQKRHQDVVLVLRDGVVHLDVNVLEWFAKTPHELHELHVYGGADEVSP